MTDIRPLLLVVLSLICTPVFAENGADPFQETVNKYLAASPKPALPEDARKFKVQAEFMVQEKQADKAAMLYGKALEIAPWWPEGHYKLGAILGDAKKYREAMREMKRYLQLEPSGDYARVAQDKIYQWELVAVPEAGKQVKDCPECPEMVEIPAGSFEMGANDGAPDEKPVHTVSLKAFAIGKTEVTQAQWQAIMFNNPSHFAACGDDCPVEQVSWNDVQEYIQRLNVKTGKQYRLPTEAEWEYACRAGATQQYCGSDNADTVAWNNYNSGSYLFNSTHPVASKQPNTFGLYDMSGNVWEWVEDNYHDSYAGAPTDGSAWMNGKMHVLRGGSWGKDVRFGRAAGRHKFGATYRDYSFGFRLARTLP